VELIPLYALGSANLTRKRLLLLIPEIKLKDMLLRIVAIILFDYHLNNILYYQRHPIGCNMNRSAVIKNLTALLTLSLFAINSCSVNNNTVAQKSDGNEDQLFATSFQDVVNKAFLVTHDHDIQIQKWKRGEHNNNTMASITDSYLPKFRELITMTKNLHTPLKFENVTKLYLYSLESELQSNVLFKNSLVSGNITESQLSDKLFSDALRYELESFSAFKSIANKVNNK
jgi:hypothetical protein